MVGLDFTSAAAIVKLIGHHSYPTLSSLAQNNQAH